MKPASTVTIWDQPQPRQLLGAINGLAATDALPAFLTDVLTEKEITEIAARLEAARLLTEKTPYTSIQAQTKLSSRTIARISSWLKKDTGGYARALSTVSTLEAHHTHIPPAPAK